MASAGEGEHDARLRYELAVAALGSSAAGPARDKLAPRAKASLALLAVHAMEVLLDTPTLALASMYATFAVALKQLQATGGGAPPQARQALAAAAKIHSALLGELHPMTRRSLAALAAASQ